MEEVQNPEEPAGKEATAYGGGRGRYLACEAAPDGSETVVSDRIDRVLKRRMKFTACE